MPAGRANAVLVPFAREYRKDVEPMIKAGWTKLAELPEEELPGGEDADTGNGTKPEGPRVNYAVGSVEWRAEMERKKLALVTDQEEKEKRRLDRVAAFLATTGDISESR